MEFRHLLAKFGRFGSESLEPALLRLIPARGFARLALEHTQVCFLRGGGLAREPERLS